MNVSKFLNIAVSRNDGCSFVAGKCIVPIMHDGFEVVRYIVAVDANLAVFVKSKPIG